jgi:tRNA threonylcarbamoyladenosine biosynthesis protein TsaB
MNILAIDTSSTACSVALQINNQVFSSHVISPMQQSKLILPMIDELLKSADVNKNQLDAIAFGCGPGSFTGIRIATSIAQGLGYALNIPLIPVSSLAALAQTVYNDLGWKNLFAAVDARMQEVYWGQYQINEQELAELVGKEGLGLPTRLVEVFESLKGDDKWYGVGDGWGVYAEQISLKLAEIDTNRLPTAAAILQLAIPSYKKQEWCTPSEVLPVYLRDDVATKEKKR